MDIYMMIERKRTDMEIWFDGGSVAIDYTVPNTLNLKQRTPGVKYIYAPLRSSECSTESQDQQVHRTSRGTKIMNSFPWLQSHLVGWGAAVKLFGEIARPQASSRPPVGHSLRRLIFCRHQPDRSIQKGNFRRLQKAVTLCSLDDPFNSLRVSR